MAILYLAAIPLGLPATAVEMPIPKSSLRSRVTSGVVRSFTVIVLLVLLLPFYYPFAIRVAANHILGKSESKITPNKELSCLRDDVRNKWPLRGSKHAVYLVTQSIGQFLTTCC